MSSSDEVARTSTSAPSKRRKTRRACDFCRRKKVGCDGSEMEDDKCSSCVAHNVVCTYSQPVKKRGPPKSYVESLEHRLQKMEKLLKQVIPGIDLSSSALDDPKSSPPRATTQNRGTLLPIPGAIDDSFVSRRMLDSTDEAPGREGDDEDELVMLKLADGIRRLTFPNEYRFFGKSSDLMLIQTALDINKERAPSSTYDIAALMNGTPSFQAYTTGATPLYQDGQRWITSLRRPEFWTDRPWERSLALALHNLPAASAAQSHTLNPHPTCKYVFPPALLLYSLVELYFEHSNAFLPLLHKPTFLKHIKEGKHLKSDDEGEAFGANLLLVCAVGSRWSDDPSVRLDTEGGGEEGNTSWHSNGWKYFNQVQLVRKSLFQAASLWDLQFFCLVILFLEATSKPEACWMLIGIGIRLAQDVGAHRRKIRNRSPLSSPTSPAEMASLAKERMEEEQWTRAWWVLVGMDRALSSAMGRPCAIHDEDFDVDLPMEVDDEYWEDPTGENDVNRMFKHPEGKPSMVSFAIHWIKLIKLWAFSLRTIYSIKSKNRLGIDAHQMVAEIDSALNKWVGTIPDHLLWDPNHPDQTFFNQSVLLYASYYHLQIIIHRPFIPSPRKPSPLSLPSLAICTNAARSCSHIADVHRRRILEVTAGMNNGKTGCSDGRTKAIQPFTMVAVFASALVLILNIWGSRRSLGKGGRAGANLSKDIENLHKCMMVLKLCEERTHFAGRLWDILAELSLVGDLPLPPDSAGEPAKGAATGRDDDVSSSTSEQFTLPPRGYPQPQEQTTTQPSQHSLPMYSAGLGTYGFGHGDFTSQQAQSPDSTQNVPPSQDDWSFLTDPSVFGSIASDSNQVPSEYNAGTPSEGGRSSSIDVNPQVHQGIASYPAPEHSGVRPEGFTALELQLQDNDVMTMWSNAPAGFEWDDWGAYLELAQGMQAQGERLDARY